MKTNEAELAVVALLNYRINVIVPNVSWGLGLRHECDMLVLDNKGRFTEIEIKISVGDLKADFKKAHGHRSDIISRLVYALPEEIYKKHGEIIPKECGVIVIYPHKKFDGRIIYKAAWERIVKHDKNKPIPNPKIIRKFMELGCMRIWSLKHKLVQNNKSK